MFERRSLFITAILGLTTILLLVSFSWSADKQRPQPSLTPRSVQVQLSLVDLTNLPIRGRLQFEDIKLQASVTNVPANSSPPLYKFVGRADTGSMIASSGEFAPSPEWTWPLNSYFSIVGRLVIFAVTVKVTTAQGTIEKETEIGPYLIVSDAKARWGFENMIFPVMTFPRCLNCHVSGDSPTQGDDRHLHVPPVNRQTVCSQCHGTQNGTAPGSPPGAPGWGLPPFSFVNKSAAQLCRQIKDPTQNGGRSLEQLEEHVRSDLVILWAWSPGPGRTPAPRSWEMFAIDGAFSAWIRNGAACPDQDTSSITKGENVCCTVVANVALKGRLGRVVVAFPNGAVPKNTRVDVMKDGKVVQSGHGNQAWELLSGTYEVKISGKPVPNVTVKAGHDTTVKVGVLRVSAGKDTKVDVLDAGKKLTSDYGDQVIGLPPGSFDIQVAGQTERVTISEGNVTDF